MSETDNGTPAASARIEDGLRVEIESLGNSIVADEPTSVGGGGEGPDPFALLYASLSACVLMTIRLYASRKRWPLEAASVRLYPQRPKAAPVASIRIELELEGALDEAQRARLLDIAGKCPVHRTLEREVSITAELA